MNFIEKISNYNKAAYPLLYIQTQEDARLLLEIAQGFQESDREVYTWDEFLGTRQWDKSNRRWKDVNPKDGEQPGEMIKQMPKHTIYGGVEKGIFLFVDFNHLLKMSKVIRCIKRMQGIWKARGCTAIMVAAQQEIPTELAREFQLVEYALPDENGLGERLNYVVKSWEQAQKKKVSISEKIREKIVNAAKGMTAAEAENAYSYSLINHKEFDEAFVRTVFDEKIQHIKKNGFLTYMPPSIGFDQIGGLGQLKDWVKLRAASFTKKAREFGLPYSRGVLLAGLPGCGKTMIGKAVSKEFNMPLFQLDIGALFGSLVGQSEQNCRSVIRTLEAIGPSVLLIDEIEKSLSSHATSGAGDSGTSSRIFGTLLSWLNDRTCPVFIVATSNNHLILPPELIRKGRFDDVFWLDLPDAQEREDIWRVVIKKYGRNPEDFDLKKLAQKSEDFTGSEVEQALISGLHEAFVRGKELENEHLFGAVVETKVQAKINPKLEEMRSYAKDRLRDARELRGQDDIEKGFRKLQMELE